MNKENNINTFNEVISVVIPVYKVEDYLQRCVNSVIRQTYSNIEIILVDDGSPDKCGMICDEFALYDSRIRVIHKENGGLSSARNAGIDVATGKYISFVDSDDWISEDMLMYMHTLAKKNESQITSVSYALVTSENDSYDKSEKVRVMNRDEALQYFLEVGMKSRVSDYPVCIKLFERSLFDNIRFPIGVLYEDYTTNIQLLKKCTTYVKSTKICYFYFQGGASIVRSPYKKQDDQLISQCMKVCDYVSDESYIIKKLAGEKLARSYFSLLTKIGIYGFHETVSAENQKMIGKELTTCVRKEFKRLIKSDMPVSRKLILLIVCISYRPLNLIGKVMK